MAAAKGGILDQGALTKALQDVLEVIPDVSIDVPQVSPTDVGATCCGG